MRQPKKYPFIVNDSIIIISLIVLTFLFLSTSVFAQVVTNPWHETRWGGDTGEQTYTEPPTPIPGDDTSCTMCGGAIMVAYIIPSYAIMTRNEPKKRKKYE